nr:uncharacterized protein LOC121503274 [Drosophila kikkawai]
MAEIRVGELPITSQRALRYLCVILDIRLCFREHLEYLHKKASVTARSLTRILLNTRRPKQCKRKLLTSVVTSQLLYAAPAWAVAVRVKSYVVQEAQEARLLREPGNSSARREVRSSARRRSIARWQCSWIGRKHGEVDLYLTQALSGHGYFRSYLKRYGHDSEDHCPECGTGVKENVHHVLFECHRFYHERLALEEVVGVAIGAVVAVVPTMLSSQKAWDATAMFVASVMKTLRTLETERRMRAE